MTISLWQLARAGLRQSRIGAPHVLRASKTWDVGREFCGITDIGSTSPPDALLPEQPEPEHLRRFARDPRMISVEIHADENATLRQRQVKISIPLANFRDRMRSWGWEGKNYERPVLLYGDSVSDVDQAHKVLVEEGFVSVLNAWTKDAVITALRRPTTKRSAP
mmetsp:Transcript_52614/g.140224  ORF Transcript_52614/g.140224 Transcript_52614/m.140224 type:complete len:164 (-) Transcript_52614:302-793(-)